MIVFDTETTGLPAAEGSPLHLQPKIIEFAGIKLHDETLEEQDRLEFLCNPGMPLPEIITKITRLTDKDLESEPPFEANLPRVIDFFLGERVMVAHNVDFDRKLLTYELQRIGMMDRFPWPFHHKCTVEASFSINGHRLNLKKLHTLATGQDFEDAHRAMPDVEALVRCVKYLRSINRL